MAQGRRGLLGSIIIGGTSALVYLAPGESPDGGFVGPILGGDDLEVTTVEAKDVDWESATIVGQLESFPGDTANVLFEYVGTDSDSMSTTNSEEVTETGEFYRALNGLEAETTYQVAALAESDGESASGEVVEFTTEAEPNIEVVTTDTVDEIAETEARMYGEVTDMTNTSEADAFFEYRPVTAENRQDSDKQIVSSPQPYDILLSGLEPGTEYEGRAHAVARDRDDLEDYGQFVTWTTESAIPDEVVDHFEETLYEGQNQTLSDLYSGELSDFSRQQTTVYEGSYALSRDSGASADAVLTNTSVTGQTWTFRIYHDGSNWGGAVVGVQSETGVSNLSGYRISHGGTDGTAVIQRYDSGSLAANYDLATTWPRNEWVAISVTLNDDGTHQLQVLDSTDSVVMDTTWTDSTYTTGGYGFFDYDGAVYWDYVTNNGV